MSETSIQLKIKMGRVKQAKPARREKPTKKASPGVKALKEIKKLQATTHLLIPKKPFIRVVKEITESIGGKGHRFTTQAIDALREASEAFLVRLFEDSSLQTVHAHRMTLMSTDMKLVMRLRDK